MQPTLKILVLYDDLSDPVVALIKNQQKMLKDDVTLMSLQEFIEEVNIFDQLNTHGTSIYWSYEADDGSTKYWTNCDTYLLNRCQNVKGVCDLLFHPDDREYAFHELTAYLKFAFTAFKYRLQPVSYYGISGAMMPLCAQWDQLSGTVPTMTVPSYYMGP
jgi:hypothetical protein